MRHRVIHELFHKLWTKAVGAHDYDKQEWLELERKIEDLVRLVTKEL